MAALMIYVDHFKAFNDTYGHPAGDACLVAVAEAIRGSCGRPGDFLCRWGGEEFLAILPSTDITAAAHVAERVLAAVRRQQLQHRGSPTDTILTVSVGGAAVVPTISTRADDLIATADHSLYDAKRRGRNRAAFERLDASAVPGDAPPRQA
jgi:diguanylate cyclase (GGDEF)-like protein